MCDSLANMLGSDDYEFVHPKDRLPGDANNYISDSDSCASTEEYELPDYTSSDEDDATEFSTCPSCAMLYSRSTTQPRMMYPALCAVRTSLTSVALWKWGPQEPPICRDMWSAMNRSLFTGSRGSSPPDAGSTPEMAPKLKRSLTHGRTSPMSTGTKPESPAAKEDEQTWSPSDWR